LTQAIAHTVAERHWLDRLLRSRRWRIALLVVVGIAVLFRIAQVAVAIDGPAWGYDFSAYWFAAQRVLEGEPVYTAAQLAGPFPPQEQYAYLYPPFLAVVLTPLPLAFGTFQAAMALWSALGIVVLIAAVWAVTRSAQLSSIAATVLLGAAVALPAVGFELVMGNVHLVLVGLFGVAWLGIRRGTRSGEIVAGVAIGIALLIKVFPIVVVLWFALTRRGTAATVAIASAIILAGATVPVVGLQPWLDYPRVLANLGPPPELWSSIAPASLLAEFIDFNIARLVIIVAGLAVLVWSALRQPAPISFSVAIMISLLVVPTMYVHYLAVAVVPLLLLALHSRSMVVPALAYVALFAGSQAGLIDLQSIGSRALALVGAIAPLAALLLVNSGGPTATATPTVEPAGQPAPSD
jgi:alpha-1,2-mannosyltransferase